MRRVVDWLFLLCVLSGGVYLAYTHQAQMRKIATELRLREPCASPLTYSVISIDPSFDIATSTVLADLKEAEGLWENPSGKDLFQYESSGGNVSVRFVYDERQAATDKLNQLGITIDQNRTSYDDLKSRYDQLKATVSVEQSSYDQKVATFQGDQASYNAQVQKWNAQGGAPQKEYQQLQIQKQQLATEFAAIKSIESTLNSNIDTINALATELNQLIVRLNLNVAQYNGTGAAGGEFEEGLYSEDSGVQSIDIYEFSSHTQLVRVLAHEMGHALGMDHVADPQAIMYKLNSASSLYATPDDIAELDTVCHFQPRVN